MGKAYEADKPTTTPRLPQIPNCSVERQPDGSLHLTHNGSGETATADTDDQVVIAGMTLRLITVWRSTQSEITLRTGDLP